MTFEQADILLDEITAFLLSCGGPYKSVTGEMESQILFSLATGQYCLGRRDGKVSYFANYWMTDDVEAVREGMRPADVIHGRTMYVLDAAGDMRGVYRDLKPRLKGAACWHRYGKGFKHFGGVNG